MLLNRLRVMKVLMIIKCLSFSIAKRLILIDSFFPVKSNNIINEVIYRPAVIIEHFVCDGRLKFRTE